ncbi:ErfK/YbiS/YcfS/YnhG [Pseudoramibacter alactolyticus ATCC 23263]|uniref:ErfK/YbiS/YcfS/YnhG n=1 Tax=Pseudoramibacter alactolyticus ATCC 23263 TaxID=887929 RepID=E6MK33_9FIRM|nr:L,D-transpeptidase family protein [Pseudoramibacter alactolyticus]EFV00552.1 ErfK/YbiS/YcfS/YnhG [Pseudoramibacter alactolyticus ATCC 23263]
MAQDEMKKNPAAAEAPVEAQAEPTPVSEASPPEAGGDTARFLEEGDATEMPDAGVEAADASADDAESAADEANAADREDAAADVPDAADEETQIAEAVTEAPDETASEAAESADETVPAEEEALPEETATEAEAVDASTGGEATVETATEEDTDSDGAGAPEESADKAADLDERAGGTDAANETAYDEETLAEDSDAGDTDADESAITESSDAEAVTEEPDETPSEAAESVDETVPAEEEALPEETAAEAEVVDASTGGETATEEDTDSDGAGAPEESADKAADLDERAGGTDAANETAYDEETSAEDSGAGSTDADESAITESSDTEAVAPSEMPGTPADASEEPAAAEVLEAGETTAFDAEAIANNRLREQAQDLTEPETAESAAEAVSAEPAAADNAEAVAADDAGTTETPAAEGRTIDLGAAETPAPAPPVKKRKKGGLIAGVAIAVLAVIYFAGAAFYHRHFFAGTTINGVAAGNRSPAAVQETVQNKAATYRLVLRGKDNHVEKVTAGALGIAYKGDAALQKLLTGQNSFAWPAMFFRKDQHAVSALRYDETKMDRVVSMLNLVTGDQVTDAQNARPVVEEDGDVRIKAAVTGNRLDKARLKTAILKAVATGDETIDLKKDRCYVEPKYQKDSPAVKRAAKVMRRYAKAKITYLFGTDSEVVDSKVFGSWLTVDGDMHVTVDEAKAADYLYQLALRTNTAYGKHTFKTTGGNTITVNGGSYGWRIDREAELRQLVFDIKSSKAVNREPAYKQRGKTRKSIYEDIGSSYVEVSIAQQHMWVYKDGRQVVSTAVVTGNTAAGHGTTPGVYYIAYKARHATLKGEDYETPVSYWLPFNGGQGIHDSWWRGAYGGTIYRGGGSHGCVNTPPGQVPAVYANVETGTPVVVYY